MNTLHIQSISCQYDSQPILQNLNLDLEQNEILCLLGASGCGKTTLLKAIAGLQPIQQGKILLNNQDLSHLPVEQRKIGFIFQDYALFPHLTVKENIAFGLQDKNTVEKQEIIEKMTALVHLNDLLQRYPHELSGGQQQRVAIARALACEPKILLLDEPFSNIDSQVRYQIIEEIKEILKQQKISAIFVTHSKEEAFAFADKLALMAQGRIVQCGKADELYTQPKNKFVAEFLGQVNYLTCSVLSDTCLSTPLGEIQSTQPLIVENERIAIPQTQVQWLLRPQHIHIDISDGDNAGIIITKQFLGQYYQYQVQISDARVLVYSIYSFSINQKVRLKYHMKPLVLFELNQCP
ncbi:MAG TPA: ABC transporter [Pasteurellaceae bacterium]|nr:ABC transporter [Pasteurellaceae bacterium]